MKVIYAPDSLRALSGHAVFLAGPTPRSRDVESWRPDAIELFRAAGYNGTLLAPEPENGEFSAEYEDQVDWETDGMAYANVVLFWVPRSIAGKMPAFTTNVEFGLCLAAGKDVAYGRPDWAEKCRYLDLTYKRLRGAEPVETLEELVSQVLARGV